jgi:hypothetical protein
MYNFSDSIEIQSNKALPYAGVIIKLLQDVLYDDDKFWKDLITNQHAVSEYFEKIGVKLVIQETDGFAYIYQPETNPDADDNLKLPRLVRKVPISYEVTLLCVLLREMLEEFDVKEIDQVKFFVTHKEIREKIELFFKERSNVVKLLKNFDNYINSVLNLGFLKLVSEDPKEKELNRYEVKRVIKAKINNQKLEEIKTKLDIYASGSHS